MNYINRIFQPENLPSWISLIAIIAVLFTLNKELSRSEIETEKDKIISRFAESTLPIQLSEVRGNPKKLQAISELVSDKLAIPTALGYEANRFDPRLKDDITVSVKLALMKHQTNKAKLFFPHSCKAINVLIVDIDTMVMNLEALRGGKIDTEFKEYIGSHRDIILKQLIYVTSRKKDDYKLALNCFTKVTGQLKRG